MKVSADTLTLLYSLGNKQAGECLAYYQKAAELVQCDPQFHWQIVNGIERFWCFLIA